MGICGKILLVFLGFLAVQSVPGQWRKQDSGTLSNLNSVYFVDSKRGWIVGARGTYLTTVDGGDSWKKEEAFTSDVIRDVYFFDRLTGWILCEASPYEDPGRPLSYLMRTSDGGNTWEKVTLSKSHDRLVRFFFTKTGVGFGVGEGGGIWQLLDDKRSWRRSAAPSQFLILAGTFTDDLNGLLVGGGGTVLVTSDGGVEWTHVTVPSAVDSRLNAVFFIDSKTGWIAGNRGKILVTNRGGRFWQEQASGVSEDLYDVFFLDSTRGWAVGDRGRIVETKTAGSTWTVVDVGVKSPLLRLFFTDRKGFAVGFGGVILRNSLG